ncbi:SdpI family protein [Chitinophaga lutea]
MDIVFIFSIGMLIAGLGRWMWKRPHKKINTFIGYRTQRSMKSQAAWDFAQVYSGKLMCWCGLGLTIAGLPLLLIPGGLDSDLWLLEMFLAMVPTVVASVLPVLLTEKKLRRLFDENGQPVQ